jgi:hypothetical protein
MFQSSKKRTSQSGSSNNNSNNAKVEVEVSLDVFSQLYSIVVTEASHLQSIVSVPTQEDNDSVAQHSNKKTHGGSRIVASAENNPPGRLADCLRPSSPAPRVRRHHDSSSAAVQERGRSRSLPPTPSSYHRRGGGDSIAQKPRVIRDISCPPSFDDHGSASTGGNQDPHNKNSLKPGAAAIRSHNRTKKPNLVTKTAARAATSSSSSSKSNSKTKLLFWRPTQKPPATRQIIPAL